MTLRTHLANAPAFGLRGISWRGVAPRSNIPVFSLLAPCATGATAPPVLRRVYEMGSRRSLAALATVLAATLNWASLAGAQTPSNTPKEEFIANAFNLSNVGRPGASQIEITINRYTSDAARDRLRTVFREKGPEALLRELQKEPPVGSIRVPGSLAYDLRYARELPGVDGGRRIVLATDRPIGFAEARNSSRTLDYPFTLIEMRLDKEGRGEGKLNIAAKLTLNDNVLVIEDYGTQPVMLTDVRKR
jgi:hypothetical protein